MKVIVTENYKEMSKEAAKIVADTISKKLNTVLGLATGSTPEGMYSELRHIYDNGEISFRAVTSVNLDEYYPISKDNTQSYRYFMNKHLFDKVDINKDNTYVPDGEAENADIECERYEKLIKSFGGIDLQILGIGRNGHIGFNEPNGELIPVTHLTGLTESTIEANSKYFESIEEMPKSALTMGIGTILGAKKIVILASGKEKHEAIVKMLRGLVTTMWPATMLNLHNDVTLICDKEAYNG